MDENNQPDQSTSPVPDRPEDVLIQRPSMNFYEALKQVVEGKKVTKLEWSNNGIYGFLSNETLMLHGGQVGDNQDHLWILREADIIGTDWVTL